MSPALVRPLKRLVRRTLLRGDRWPYRAARLGHLADRLRGAASRPGRDLVFVNYGDWGSWILGAICREIAARYPGDCAFHGIRHDQYGSGLPAARAYFFAHYSLFPRALRFEPNVWGGRSVVYYTHPQEWGLADDELIYALNHATWVVCMNAGDREELVARGLDPRRATVVLGAADPGLFPPHRRSGEGVVGFCTAYYPRKAPERVVELVRRMPHRRFLLLGRDWHRYERFAELRALPNFEYVEAPYEDYPGHYGRMDVFVSPARVEGGPIPLVEAMMSNVVPVASRTGFAPEIIRDGENGFVFDVDAPIEQVCALVDRAYELQGDIRATVEHLSWDSFAREIRRLVDGPEGPDRDGSAGPPGGIS